MKNIRFDKLIVSTEDSFKVVLVISVDGKAAHIYTLRGTAGAPNLLAIGQDIDDVITYWESVESNCLRLEKEVDFVAEGISIDQAVMELISANRLGVALAGIKQIRHYLLKK